MARLEDLKEGASVKGIRPDGPVTIINVKWHGDSVVELTYKDSSGRQGNEIQARLQNRMEELKKEKQLSPLTPVVMGGALVVPGGLMARLKGKRDDVPDLFARETKRVEQRAM